MNSVSRLYIFLLLKVLCKVNIGLRFFGMENAFFVRGVEFNRFSGFLFKSCRNNQQDAKV